jgi:hypothetical protein
MGIWEVLPDGNNYRSLDFPNLTPREDLEVVRLFRSGEPLGAMWKPMRVEWYEAEGEEQKPVGHFPSMGGSIPLAISAQALKVLSPLIQNQIEVLDLITEPPLGTFYALNIFFADCLDHSRSVFVRFDDGRIMRVDKYAFRPKCLEGKHLFRLPEVWTYVFADDVLKQAVEQNGLGGLVFYKVPLVDEV